jgi:hypothetical protein
MEPVQVKWWILMNRPEIIETRSCIRDKFEVSHLGKILCEFKVERWE